MIFYTLCAFGRNIIGVVRRKILFFTFVTGIFLWKWLLAWIVEYLIKIHKHCSPSHFLAAVLIRPGGVVLMLCRKNPFDVDSVKAAPVENPEYAVYHFCCDAFEFLTVIEVHIGFDLFVIVVEIHKRLIVAVFFKSFGKFAVAKGDRITERVRCIFFVPTVIDGIFENFVRKAINADISRNRLFCFGTLPTYLQATYDKPKVSSSASSGSCDNQTTNLYALYYLLIKMKADRLHRCKIPIQVPYFQM